MSYSLEPEDRLSLASWCAWWEPNCVFCKNSMCSQLLVSISSSSFVMFLYLEKTYCKAYRFVFHDIILFLSHLWKFQASNLPKYHTRTCKGNRARAGAEAPVFPSLLWSPASWIPHQGNRHTYRYVWLLQPTPSTEHP